MNDTLHARLTEHIDPDHECSPHNGGCDMPHYLMNFGLPRYVAQWPEGSEARLKLDDLRELREIEAE
ncbi:MAG: hypothetical protein EPO65_02905 [Dehalococcoidia bacterium]|nr:MAG: hypothetical protein EPO65_02905 [Dehalococcoidia bacterium]